MEQAILHDKCLAGMVLTAVGDALGWPYEFPRRTIGIKEFVPGQLRSFQQRMGSRGVMLTKLKPIEKGAYSDDTQMTLMTARALLAKNEDAHFMREMVYFLEYQRGGGRRVKGAARAYVAHTTPWTSETSHEYFEGGSNGGIMRQFPIAIQHRLDESPEPLLNHLVHHVLLTHGHPAALIGSMIIGLAQHYALRHTTPMEPLAFLNYVLDHKHLWSTLPVASFPDGWLNRYQFVMKCDYQDTWQEIATIFETQLTTLQDYLNRSEDEQFILTELSVQKKPRGYGLPTTIGVLYYLERYLQNPVEGLINCTSNSKIDCDTQGAILGSILGALHGTAIIPDDWYNGQDGPYIRQLAHYLLADNPQQAYATAINEALQASEYKDWKPTPLGPARFETPTVIADFKTTTTYQQTCHSILGQTFYIMHREKK